VAALTPADMLMVTPTGSMLRVFRGGLDQGAVVAWSRTLCEQTGFFPDLTRLFAFRSADSCRMRVLAHA
jgi:hypothetical protein